MADPIISPIIKKNYGDKLTLDLDTSLPAILPEGCLDLKNVIRRHGKGLAKRPGVRMSCGKDINANSGDIYIGLHRYFYTSSFGLGDEILIITGGDNARVYHFLDTTVTLSYSGAGTASFYILASGGVWTVALYVDGVLVSGWPKTYGDGVTSSSKTLQTLRTEIGTAANWALTGITSPPDSKIMVAQIGSIQLTTLAAGSPQTMSITIKRAYPFTVANSPTVTTQNVGVDADYSNLKGVTAANCMFFPMGKKLPLLKYDGHLACKPGMPRAQLVSLTDAGSGTSHASAAIYIYRVSFWRVDNRDNEIFGPYSDDTLAVATHAAINTHDINITFTPITRAGPTTLDVYNGLLYDPRSAIVNGNQVSVNDITVSSGHSFAEDDQVYLYDAISATYVTRSVTGTSATVVSIDGSPVTVATLAIISNIRVRLQRTDAGGVDFFLLEDIPCDCRDSVTTQVYKDAITDLNLGASIEEQAKLPEPPPNAKIMCLHQGLWVIANLEDDPLGFAWNDTNWGFEAFPSATNRDQVLGSGGGEITAMVSESDSSLAIFKDNNYFRIQGDLGASQYVIVEIEGNDLGIASQASLVKTSSGIFGISEKGPVFIQKSTSSIQAPAIASLDLSVGILNYFYANEPNTEGIEVSLKADIQKLVVKRSTGVYWKEHDIILFFIPAETGAQQSDADASSIIRYANANSLWLCFDLKKLEWRNWEFADFNINAHIAMELFKDRVYFISSNQYGAGPGYSANNFVWRFLDSEDPVGYADNASPINFNAQLQWEALGFESSEKKMTALKVFARHPGDFIASSSVTVKEYRNGDTSAPYLNTSRIFSNSTDLEKIIEPIPGDFISNSIAIGNNTIYECPVISGLAIEYKLTSSSEIKDIKGDG